MRDAAKDRQQRGAGKPETFNFLGFTHYCGRRHKTDTFTVWRITAKKRMVAKLKAIKVELRRRMHARPSEVGAWRRFATLYTPLLRTWFRTARLQPADCDDLAQQTLAVLLRRLPEFHHNGQPGAFRTWLRENADMTDEEEDEIASEVKKTLNDALKRAEESPLPDPATLLQGVYATPEDLDTPHHK